jgi:Bacterial PH domain
MEIMEALTARMLAMSETVPAGVYRVLLPHERRVSSTRQHPAVVLGPGLLAAAGLVAAAILSALVADGNSDVLLVIWAAWLILLLRLALKIGDWTASFFVVTSARIIMVSGFLRTKVDIIPLGTVNDMTIGRTLRGSLFSCADLTIAVGAPDQIIYKITYLPEAERMYLRISSVIFPPKRIPCPLCRGEGTAFRRPQAGDASTFETRSEDSKPWDGYDPEPWDDYLAPGNGRTAGDLIAAGYQEAECPRCHGRGTVYAEGINSQEEE